MRPQKIFDINNTLNYHKHMSSRNTRIHGLNQDFLLNIIDIIEKEERKPAEIAKLRKILARISYTPQDSKQTLGRTLNSIANLRGLPVDDAPIKTRITNVIDACVAGFGPKDQAFSIDFKPLSDDEYTVYAETDYDGFSFDPDVIDDLPVSQQLATCMHEAFHFYKIHQFWDNLDQKFPSYDIKNHDSDAYPATVDRILKTPVDLIAKAINPYPILSVCYDENPEEAMARVIEAITVTSLTDRYATQDLNENLETVLQRDTVSNQFVYRDMATMLEQQKNILFRYGAPENWAVLIRKLAGHKPKA
jgi:hypothetical protein